MNVHNFLNRLIEIFGGLQHSAHLGVNLETRPCITNKDKKITQLRKFAAKLSMGI